MRRWIILIFALWGVMEFILGRFVPNNEKLSKLNLNSLEVYWNYILNKIDESEKIDLLILGDSTTRYALDEELISRETGYSTLNAATFGNFATYGNWRILRYCLENHKKPKAIVMWHSIDVWERKIDDSLFSYSNPSCFEVYKNLQKKSVTWEEKSKMPIRMGSAILRTGFYQLPSIRYRFWWNHCLKLSPAQQEEFRMKEISSEEMIEGVLKGRTGISEENRYWFKKIAQKCNEKNITLFFSRAYLLRSVLEDARITPYLKDQNTRLNQMTEEYPNIRVLSSWNEPLETSETNGDKDHVNEKGKKRISIWYSNFLKDNPL